MGGGFAGLGQWLDRHLGEQWREPQVRRFMWGGLFFVCFTLLLATAVAPAQVRVRPGQAAPRDLVAPKQLVDRPATERLRQEAARAVPDQYQEDDTAAQQARQDVERAFQAVDGVREAMARRVRQQGADQGTGQAGGAAPGTGSSGDGGLPAPTEADRALLAERLGFSLPAEVADAVLTASDTTLAAMRRDLLALLQRELDQGIKEDQLAATRMRLGDEIGTLDHPRPLQEFLRLVGGRALRPNLIFDRAGTEEARRRAMEQVDPVVIVPGEVIVEAGEKVTEEDMVRLRDAGLLQEDLWGLAGIWAGTGLLVLLGMAAGGAYLATFDRRVYEDEPRFVLFGLVPLITLVFARLLQPVSPYLMPVATGPMLLAVLLNPRTALVAAMLLAAAVGVMAGDGLRLGIMAWLGGAAATFAISRLGHRSDFMRAGAVVAAVNAATTLGLALMFGSPPLAGLEVWKQVGWAAFGGLLAAILTIGLLPFLESFFGLVTPVRLIELANPNQPLLRRLLVEAPGTYHHSLMVANLAEAAVEEIGGNSLLARVGAYYHDVGKVRRPYFFIENQFGGENPHDKLSPNLSALIITAHVKDGIELARQHGLPEEIVRFIREHHGTTRVEYFLRRAQEQGEPEVLEANFRYDGPPPTTRETAVVMLADAVEATVRSLGHLTPGRIEQVVRKIIKDRLNDGQLDRADLTLRDLDRIAGTFVRVLTGVFHHRIEYPDVVLKEMERSRRRDGPGKEAAGSAREGASPGKEAGHSGRQEKGSRKPEDAGATRGTRAPEDANPKDGP
ncbi:7TM receptor with intracellular metal dependent phosphohydrolase [Thermaerobacter marianensis DSM 12885]|uniref:7TM receptor with intracellular metal dependent phosphohydrolase n=1 Tax=Thermaerobacter marianensis (strain ATCC 700841 / DSM 12885 / JCM 10246 / 7p75a) TaxID=644966 RepID=E6SK93_THEM7|nr:HDIG domain-containing metalloprotein [Thermaerobacter marianensis]ADU52251.1 7TM receptor with intracellular metal dependent phosphohydrolase [Thermaerobacter marianensis DSM 12885]